MSFELHLHSVEITSYILCEIDFEDSRSSKSASLTYSKALNLDSYKVWHFLNQIFTKSTKFSASKMTQILVFELQYSPKLISRKNLRDRKVLKFPHCNLTLNRP